MKRKNVKTVRNTPTPNTHTHTHKFRLAWQTAEPGREVHANCHNLSFSGKHVRILSGS